MNDFGVLKSRDREAHACCMSQLNDFADDSQQAAQWDEHLNTRKEGAQFRLDVNGVPGWYVYYDMYGWC
jgi:hypothetical protein